MNEFSLEAHLEEVYKDFPEACQRPIIGITTNYVDGDAILRDRYYKQVIAAGGIPILIPPVADKDVIVNTLNHIDGLLLTGGGDYNPLWAGQEPQKGLQGINAERDLPELLITRLAYNRQIPMLGICRGIQTLAMVLGGEVVQDIAASLKHSQEADRSLPTHSIKITPDSSLYNIYGKEKIYVNSFHHQAVGDAGSRFRVIALSEDGIVEAIESTEYKPIMGVQWHPEWLQEEGQKLFRWLVVHAGEFLQAKSLHDRILTLDSHCDTRESLLISIK